MSSALVRQALELVDPDESSVKRKKRGGTRHKGATGQDLKLPQQNPKSKNLKNYKRKEEKKQKDKATKEVIQKLLELSKPVSADKEIAKKIVKRAVKGRPLLEKVKTKAKKEKSILFPDEDFEQFERELFCS